MSTLEKKLIEYFDDEHADFPLKTRAEAEACVDWLKQNGLLLKDIAKFSQVSASQFSAWRLQRRDRAVPKTQTRLLRALNQPFQDELQEDPEVKSF